MMPVGYQRMYISTKNYHFLSYTYLMNVYQVIELDSEKCQV